MSKHLLRILEELEKQQQQQRKPKPSQPKVLSQTPPLKERDFGDKRSIIRNGDSLGQTSTNIGDKHLIELLRNVRVLLLPISSSKNTVRRGGKKYVYIRKRVDLPSDYNEENVVVLSPSEFLRLMEVLSISFSKAFGVSFDMEKVKKWLFGGEGA